MRIDSRMWAVAIAICATFGAASCRNSERARSSAIAERVTSVIRGATSAEAYHVVGQFWETGNYFHATAPANSSEHSHHRAPPGGNVEFFERAGRYVAEPLGPLDESMRAEATQLLLDCRSYQLPTGAEVVSQPEPYMIRFGSEGKDVFVLFGGGALVIFVDTNNERLDVGIMTEGARKRWARIVARL